jgi:hypothetical protein
LFASAPQRSDELSPGQILAPHHPGNSISISWLDLYGQSHTATVVLASGPAA